MKYSIHTFLIKVYHSHEGSVNHFISFLNDVGKTMKKKTITFGLNYSIGQFYYSLAASEKAYSYFESQFYTYFNNFQIIKDNGWIFKYNLDKTVVGELYLENSWFFPFKHQYNEQSDFIHNIFRSFENLDVINDKVGVFIELSPVIGESFSFYIKSKFELFFFRIGLFFRFFKYIFNFKVDHDWKHKGFEHLHHKLHSELFATKIYIVVQSHNKIAAEGKLNALFVNFKIFKNYPLNLFHLKTHLDIKKVIDFEHGEAKFKVHNLSAEEVAAFFHFPKSPKSETSLLKVTARKLTLPIGVPTFPFTVKNNEVFPESYPDDINIIGISDFRSIRVPIGMYDEDRLRHIYVIGKTGVGKSKFISSLLVDDLKQGKGLGLIDPHGDLIEEIFMHIPPERMEDVIIFDPTDEAFPFCLNPLDVKRDESKQILAKGFIDIFKKFFGANWNPKLEHVLRMVFLALLDKPKSTLFDIIRALTDKDFRYEMIEAIDDDVVRNFWTNEFAGWSQQFNTEAIMPILNKVGQLLSVDILKNIFSSVENKLDFRVAMDEKKILLIKLSKGKLQEEIMGFLGAMFVTKLFQAAMSRQSLPKNERTPFFLYVDEFQNFATDTFNEILSEARKYGLGLCVAHQFIKQIPDNISDALFGNVGTIVSFRISSEDALYMKNHFEPFLDAYDLANLNQRELYCKMLVKGQVKDPFSLQTVFTPDKIIDKSYIEGLYEASRRKYSRSLAEAKKSVKVEQKDVISKIESFSEPII